MDRRNVLKAGAVPAAALSLSAPALAQTRPKVNWRLTSSFPRTLDTLYGAAAQFARMVSEATDGDFTVRVFSPGEIVPALEARDAVSKGSVECCFTASSYSIGTDPAFMFGTVLLFGLNSRQQMAWLYDMDGNGKLNRLLYEKHNVLGFPLASTGAQMGGWFRKEIRTVQDLSGLKFRIGGLAGHVFQRLGAVPQQIGAGDIYPSLERGTIDARGVGRPLRRREARPLQGRTLLLLPRMVGRHGDPPPLRQQAGIREAAGELPQHRANRRGGDDLHHPRALRCAEPAGAAAAGGAGRAGAALPAAGAGRLL